MSACKVLQFPGTSVPTFPVKKNKTPQQLGPIDWTTLTDKDIERYTIAMATERRHEELYIFFIALLTYRPLIQSGKFRYFSDKKPGVAA